MQAGCTARSAPKGNPAAVSDISVPELDGRGLIQAMRALGIRVPAVPVTGLGYVESADAEQYGAWRILHKPFRAGDFPACPHLDAIVQESERNEP